MEKKVGIVGYGEVGKAIASFYEDPFIHDPVMGHEFPLDVQFDILHICIPYRSAAEFGMAARLFIKQYAKGGLTFIHSTVPVGTTKLIAEEYPFVVHSPVRGVHPHLAEGIRTFPKYVGADSAGAARLAVEHLEEIGITPTAVRGSKATELLKLLDTTYYGAAIAFHAYAKRLCEQEGVNFDLVMTDANTTYNEGYAKLGKPNVVRPVLYPPDGPIGGHCVVPNAEILRDQYGDDAILEAILRHK